MQNQFEIRENGKVITPKEYKKRFKAALKAITHAAGDIIYFIAISPLKGFLRELGTQIKLKVFDAIYKTNLFKQRESGLRTQRILSAKRTYGLI